MTPFGPLPPVHHRYVWPTHNPNMALDPRIKAVGFDMDGTFMRTRVDYVKLSNCVVDEFISRGAPREMFEGVHYKMDLDEGYRWLETHGMASSKEEIKKAINDRAAEIEIEHADIAKPFPGAIELVMRLRSMGYRTGILTRGGRHYATTILGAYGLLGYFDGLVARDDYDEETEAKPAGIALTHLGEVMGDIDAEDILYVGDGVTDYMTAARAGSPFIAVTSGRTDAEMWKSQVAEFLRKEPHTGYSADNLVIMDSVADILGIL